ncbi:MAG: hypothetical protein ABJA11_05180, partial [Pseudolysinimonas sp.]
TVDTAVGATAQVPRSNTGTWMTATVALPDGALTGTDGKATRLRISLTGGSDDLVVRFVRLVRLAP